VDSVFLRQAEEGEASTAALNPNRIFCTLAVCLTPAPASSGDSWAIWWCGTSGLACFPAKSSHKPVFCWQIVVLPSAWFWTSGICRQYSRPVFLPCPHMDDGVMLFSTVGGHARNGDGGPEPYLAQWPLTRRKQAPENASISGMGPSARKGAKTALLARNACVRLTLNSISVASSGYDPGSQAALQARSLRRSSASQRVCDAVSGSLLASRPHVRPFVL